MNIEHKLEPIEHWIVDGKAYRLATEADVGKECYRSDYSFENAIDSTEPVRLRGFVAGYDMPYQFGALWRFAYIQDDSLLTPQRTPVPALGDGWYLLTADDGEFKQGDKVKDANRIDHSWTTKTIMSSPQLIADWLRDGWLAARYFDPVSSEPQEIQAKDTHDTPKPIDWTKPVRTKKHKKPVRVVCTDGPGDYPVIGILDGDVDFWDLEGNLQDDGDNNWCLENVPSRIQREYWVNVYPDSVSFDHATKEKADKGRTPSCIACVKITIDCEEGEGL